MSNPNEPMDVESTAIAVIGMSGRFPGSASVDEFWEHLRNGVELISTFSDEELKAGGIDPEVLDNSLYVKAGAVLKDADKFDAQFFGFSAREAEIIDPQHRIFLECAWEALEDAGYSPEMYGGEIGVYAGVGKPSYVLSLLANPGFMKTVGSYHVMIGNDKDFLPTLVSYKLNLKGPSMGIQTACSTSLVAVHVACQSLLNGECNIALAGGVAVTFPQVTGYFYQEGGIASPDGHCRAFDARARGTVGGNGAGVVTLKRLTDALADGDTIHSVIRGTAVNNDGSSKVGYTAPSIDGQARVIAEAQFVAGVDPETVTYVEAHGTGTSLGDPIEIAALTKAFRTKTDKKHFCAIGSVKTNVGHLDVAAGITGFLKTVQALKNKQIPPSLHFEQPNPEIDFENSPFFVNNKLTAWDSGITPRRAGVSSFGIGGTNAHVIVEEASERPTSPSGRPAHLLVLSAKTKTALSRAIANLSNFLTRNPNVSLADMAYTLQVGRRAFDHRQIAVCHDVRDAVSVLEGSRQVIADHSAFDNPPVVFMFPGQGAQHTHIGAGLYQTENVFRQCVDECCEILKAHLGLDLREVIYPTEEGEAEAKQQIEQTALAQPTLFVVEYALAKLWMSWGIRPEAMIGHSVGEYVAAYLAGCFSLEEALALVVLRGRLMQQAPPGAMLTVSMSAEELDHLWEEENSLSLAAVNGPSLFVVAGPTDAIKRVQQCLMGRGVFTRQLRVSHAFHSTLMDPVVEPFAERLREIHLKPPQLPFISNLTGEWISADEATDPNYWARHLRHTVRFADGLQKLTQQPERILLEVGPGRTLTVLAKQYPGRDARQIVLSSLGQTNETPDTDSILNALGQLWLGGASVDWQEFWKDDRRWRISLPAYPFERQRYWIDPPDELHASEIPHRPADRRKDLDDWFYLASWKRTMPPATVEFVGSVPARWLVFANESGISAQLMSALRQVGNQVISIKCGEGIAKLGESEYCINPHRRDDYAALFNELSEQKKLPTKILHGWSLMPNESARRDPEFFEEVQHLGFYSLLWIAKAIGNRESQEKVEIFALSNNMQDVSGEEYLLPEKATILGPCRVIPQEYPNLACRSIDIHLPEPNSLNEKRLIDQCLAELLTPQSDQVVAYRGTNRWSPTFSAARLKGRSGRPIRLREGGCYLITGGLGGIGLALADYLARTVQAKLILTGRRGLPARGEWEYWLAAHQQDSVSQIIRQVLLLEERGATALVARADVTRREELKEVVKLAYARFGEIHGVIHAAGVPGDGIIQLKTPERAAQVLAPKVLGALALSEIFQDSPLDFMALCSSISSITGGVGQVDYCAANAFLDAFAHSQCSKNSMSTIAINWDVWQGVGMAAAANAPGGLAQYLKGALSNGISPDEGGEAFSRILSSATPQIVVSTRDLHSILKAGYNSSNIRNLERLLDPPKSTHQRPNLVTSYVAPRNEFEERIARIWQRLLGVEPIGVNDNFIELGGHSLLAVQAISRLREAFKVEIHLRDFFENPTIEELASVMEEALIRRLDELSEEESQQLLEG